MLAFLIESLNALDTEEIEFKMLEPNKSALVLPIKHEEKEEEKEKDEDILMLVMPILLGRN